jgi:hypothetical protein
MHRWTAAKIASLRAAQQNRTYKETHHTFERYCQEEFGISRAQAYRIVRGERCQKVPISAELRWEIWERDDFRCAYCWQAPLSIT